jgi:hypothetical protein
MRRHDRMKKQILMSLAMVILAASLMANELPSIVFHVNTGVSRPMAPEIFKETHLSGYNIGLSAGKYLSSRFQVEGSVCLNNFGFDKKGFTEYLGYSTDEFSAEGGKAWGFTAMGKIRADFPPGQYSKMIPYVSAGLGLFMLTEEDIDYTIYLENEPPVYEMMEGGKETTFGTSFGIGLDYILDKPTSFFLEINCTVGFTEEKATVFFPIKFGISIKL